MKKTITILTILLGLSLLVNILFVAGVFKPDSNANVYLTKECHDIGRNIHDNSLANALENQLYFRGEYTYNPELETCLYATGFTQYPPTGSDAKTYTERMIIDSLTNQVILKVRVTNEGALGIRHLDCDVCASSVEEYDRKKAELFNK